VIFHCARGVVLEEVLTAAVSKVGYYMPFGALGLGIGAIGTGLLTILMPNSSTGDWVGFEFLTGIRGMSLQVVCFSNSIFSLGLTPLNFNPSYSQNPANQSIIHSH
jgi:hypothetical protein